MKRPLRFTLIWASFAATFAVFASSAFAGAVTLYASPTGIGNCKTAATPCKLEKAVAEAVNDDSVVVGPGTYTLASGLSISQEIDLGGQAGAAPPVLQIAEPSNFSVNTTAKPHIHDLRIEGSGGLVVNSGVAERLFVAYTGKHSAGCSFYIGTVVTDSVCWAHGQTNGASALMADAPGVKGTVTLRNVTAVSTSDGAGIYAEGSTGGNLTVIGTNVIAYSPNNADVEAILSGGGLPASFVQLSHSSYQDVEELAPLATVTPPGTNGNITALSSFTNAAAGDFTEVIGSPTIDAGINDPLNGATDLAGDPRSLGACIGGAPITDIGAYEFVPTVACPVPVPPVSNEFTIGKLTLNKKQGVGTLAVKLPDAGKLTLSGKGVKKVTRSANGAATLKLPVKPVGKWKKALLETGKLKVSLKLKFVPTGGSAAEKSKKATLKETVH